MHLSHEQKLEKIKKLKAKKISQQKRMVDYREKNRLEFFDQAPNPGPNPKQAQILEAFLDIALKTFGMSGGNRLGKCLISTTYIETPKGNIRVGDLYSDGKPFDVYAWDGRNKVIARANAPIKKLGLHRCYEFGMSNGETMGLADNHRVLTSHGWFFVEQLFSYFCSLQESSGGTFPLIDVSDVSHLIQKQSGFREHYSGNFHRCGEQPLRGKESVQESVPLQVGVQEHIHCLSCGGDPANKHTSTPSLDSVPLSIQDAQGQNEGRFFELLYDVFCTVLKHFDFYIQSVLRPIGAFYPLFQSTYGSVQSASLSCVGPQVGFLYDDQNRYAQRKLGNNQFSPRSIYRNGLQLQPSVEPAQRQSSFGSSNTPFGMIGENQIEYIKPISKSQAVYDFEVPQYHNYFAGGLIHHNTTILTILGFSVLFGKYLWNNQSLLHLFPHKNPRKVRYVGQGWHDHIQKVVIPELQKWWPQARPVETKGNGIITDTFWQDKQTGGTLEIMSNNQDHKEHEGWNGDLLLYDEPCKRDIYVANARGLVDRRGREVFAATLLGEAWIDRDIVKKVGPDGKPDKTVFWINGTIYDNVGYGISKEGADEFLVKLTDNEKQARIYGIPEYMQGLVYPQFNRKEHLWGWFKTPLHWMVDIGIDVHPREKQAILFVATDERNDRYICDEIWDNGDGTWVGEEIVRRITRNSYRVNRIIIDPLSKGDQNNQETTYQKIFTVLARHGFTLETASKDKDAGILEVKKHLRGPNNKPSIFLLDNCMRTLMEIEGYLWNKDTNKPLDKDDHMLENLYRICLLNTKYVEPEEENKTHARSRSGQEQGRNMTTGY
jgi:hypothetical protein